MEEQGGSKNGTGKRKCWSGRRGNAEGVMCSVFFIFVFFKKKLQKYIFGFRFYSSIPLPPGRGRQGAYRPAGGR